MNTLLSKACYNGKFALSVVDTPGMGLLLQYPLTQ